MTDLSPQALATLDAYMNNCGWLDGPLERDYRCVAAVLRAAADQVVPEFWHEEGDIYAETKHDVRADLLAIAAELEGAQ
jgi:hypothetical protein